MSVRLSGSNGEGPTSEFVSRETYSLPKQGSLGTWGPGGSADAKTPAEPSAAEFYALLRLDILLDHFGHALGPQDRWEQRLELAVGGEQVEEGAVGVDRSFGRVDEGNLLFNLEGLVGDRELFVGAGQADHTRVIVADRRSHVGDRITLGVNGDDHRRDQHLVRFEQLDRLGHARNGDRANALAVGIAEKTRSGSGPRGSPTCGLRPGDR